MKKLLAGIALALLLAGARAGALHAQSVTPTPLGQVTQADLIPDVPGGLAGPASYWVNPQQISNVQGYTKTVPLTAFSLTFANSQSAMLIEPAATLAAGTVTLAAQPSDGAQECLFSTQTVTALAVDANSGQTINNAVTTLSANGHVCYLYSVSNQTWDRSQ